MQSEIVLDEIVTEHKTYHGIIDFSSAKNYIFYDVDRVADKNMIVVAILWKSYFTDKRFSLFVKEYFSGVDIGEPVMIPRRWSDPGKDVEQKSPKRKIVGKISV